MGETEPMAPPNISTMPLAGDVCPGFITQPDRCWRMVYSDQLQPSHCELEVGWRGWWTAPSGKRKWEVSCCDEHRAGLEGVRLLP
jgi:hypothetical protein